MRPEQAAARQRRVTRAQELAACAPEHCRCPACLCVASPEPDFSHGCNQPSARRRWACSRRPLVSSQDKREAAASSESITQCL